MSFEFLLPLETYPDPTPSTGLPRVLDFAAQLGGRVTMLTHEVVIPPVHNALADAVIAVSARITEAEARSRANAASLATEVAGLAERHALPVDHAILYCQMELAPGRIARIARTYDMTLLVRGADRPPDIAQAILFDAGGPLVVFPDRGTTANLHHIALAWDGGRAAARAMRDALPILAMAKSVIVLTVEDDKAIDIEHVHELRRLLSRHNIASDHVSAELAGESIGQRLQQAALASGAGLLVMGAYGHNRLREFVLGGATRGVLGDVRLPILMSH